MSGQRHGCTENVRTEALAVLRAEDNSRCINAQVHSISKNAHSAAQRQAVLGVTEMHIQQGRRRSVRTEGGITAILGTGTCALIPCQARVTPQ